MSRHQDWFSFEIGITGQVGSFLGSIGIAGSLLLVALNETSRYCGRSTCVRETGSSTA